MTSGVDIVVATTDGQRDAAFDVRRRVFVDEQDIDPDIEHDEHDATAVHFLASRGDRPVGAARLVLEADATGVVGRVSVLSEERNQGIGGALMRAVETYALEHDLPRLELHAQVYVRRFYEERGWVPFGHEYLEAGIHHISMGKPIPVVRDVVDADGPRLEGLVGSCWAEHPGMVLDVDAEETWLRAPGSYYRQVGGQMWVAELEGELVACCGLIPRGPEVVELKSMYVARRARRRGLARDLERRAVDAATRRGAARIELWSDTRFTDAHTVYEHLGYSRLPGSRELNDLSASSEFPFVKELPAG